MKNNLTWSTENQTCTTPNLPSLFHIGLVPLFAWTYCLKGD